LNEPLNGLTAANAKTTISDGNETGAVILITGRLLKVADLTAFTVGGNDVIYGGLGDDFLHGGAGNDGISGAEAQAAFYNDATVTNTNPLPYDPVTRKLQPYNGSDPFRRIPGFFLNFDATNGGGARILDGKDRLFGDEGHDWLVGGTQNDRHWGGMGDEVLNLDDNHDTNGGANNTPDSPAFADADFAFGGGGLDVLLANTGADRLYDWSGAFNSMFVPFNAGGSPTITRSHSPGVQDFLTALARGAGADQTLTEPNGELGLLTPQDPGYGDQQGNGRDPSPPNTGNQRDTKGGPENDAP
jgi:hypothetical protein